MLLPLSVTLTPESESYIANTVIALVILAIVVFVVVRVLLRGTRDSAAPVVRADAVVVSTRCNVLFGQSVTNPSRCSVELLLDGSSTLKFRVTREVYAALEPDDVGVVTYRGSHFMGFEKK